MHTNGNTTWGATSSTDRRQARTHRLLLRLRRAERVLDYPWTLDASLALDAALATYEATTARAS